ncbi:G2/mitotic-specific cyclin [Savitreella phatthalungensis]
MNGTRRTTRNAVDHAVQAVHGDENARPSRLTRAKSHMTSSTDATVKTLSTSTTSTGLAAAVSADVGVPRKRAALGDVSNHAAAAGAATGALQTKKASVSTLPAARTTIPLRSKSTNTNIPTAANAAATQQKRKVTAVKLPAAREHSVEVAEPPLKKQQVITRQDLHAPAAPSLSTDALDYDDLDAEDAEDPLMVSEYVVEIFKYLRYQEGLTMPAANYMSRQKDLQWKMRGILVDWLIEVHTKFRLLPETLFLAVNIIDRFLSLRVCSLPKLQLVGLTALFIAAKYEEVMCPSIQNFIYMADGGYTDEEILQAEQYVLQTLDFNLSYPNPMNFLRRISKADAYDIQVRTVAKYLLEISLVDHRFLPFPPSLLSAAGMYLARYMLDRGGWDANLQHYSGGYAETQLVGCVKLMIDYLLQPVRHDAFFKKYAARKFIKASLYVREWVKKSANAHLFDDVHDDKEYEILDE